MVGVTEFADPINIPIGLTNLGWIYLMPPAFRIIINYFSKFILERAFFGGGDASN